MRGTALFCNDCGTEVLGYLDPQKGLTIYDRRHGTYHVLSLETRQLLEKLSGTHTVDGVVNFVIEVLND